MNAGSRPRLCALSSAITAVLAVSSAGHVRAQEQPKAERSVEEITVTGTRIKKQDFTANSPLQTVDQQAFEQTSLIGVEMVLNKMPQFVPAVTQFTTGEVAGNMGHQHGRRGDRQPARPRPEPKPRADQRQTRDADQSHDGRRRELDPLVGHFARRGHFGRRVGRIRRGRRRRCGQLHPGGHFEGASVDARFGDTEHGGNQTTTISGLFGVNSANDRGNVMFGIERNTRTKEFTWQRDWRVADMANPATPGGGFAFGSATWFTNEPQANLAPSCSRQCGQPEQSDAGRGRRDFPAYGVSQPQ